MGAALKIGTRGSKLAQWQAYWVKDEILKNNPDLTVDIVIIKTKGDKILDVPLAKVGGKGLFVKEIEEALLSGAIDLAVHSMKDMPAAIPPGLTIAAVPMRENPQDVLISAQGHTLDTLPAGARVGTSSLRRSSQILHARPDAVIIPLRGNIDTRLKKLDDGEFDAIVLAAAGVLRLGYDNRITQILDDTRMLPAVGQGALCVEIRENDPRVKALVDPLNHAVTEQGVTAERAFLHRLEGSCQVPVAAHAVIAGDTLSITGLVADLDGSRVFKDSLSGPCDQSAALGVTLAETLLARGANHILDQLKEKAHENDNR
ncbi:hydroxymethylbilane synthase [Desulfatiferula olefinivorans]